MNEAIRQAIPRLAELYDAYANALDPESHQQAVAAIAFAREIAELYDICDSVPKLSARDFRRTIIGLCKEFLRSEKKRDRPI